MAVKKKTKTKSKKAKKTKKKAPARKAVRSKAARKRAPAKKALKTKAKKAKSKAQPKAARKKQAVAPAGTAPEPAAAPVAPPGERIGVVTHYFTHLSVAIVDIETGSLRVGELVRIKGHTSDFSQPVESMEIDHVHVDEAHAGQSVGLRVSEHAREHDVVYKLTQ